MRLLVLVRAETKVLEGLARVLGATQEERVGAGRLGQSELIERDRLAASSRDASASSGGEAQSRDFGLGRLEQAVIIGDGANYDDRLLLVAVLQVGGDTGERHGRAVDARHEEAAEDDLVEGAVGTTSQETVELHQELEVDIVAGAEEPN